MQGRFEVAFRVDQEVRSDDDLVAFGNAFLDFDIAVAAHAGLDLARLEAAFALIDDHDLARTAVDDRVFRDGDNGLLAAAFDHDIGIHVRAQDRVGIGELDAHARRPRLLVQHRIDEADLPGKGAVGIAARRDHHLLAGGDQTEIAFGHVGQHPDHRKIGDAEQHVARLRLHAFDDIVLGDVAVARRGPYDGQRAFPGAFDVFDDLFGNAEVFKALAGATVWRQAADVHASQDRSHIGPPPRTRSSYRRASRARLS